MSYNKKKYLIKILVIKIILYVDVYVQYIVPSK